MRPRTLGKIVIGVFCVMALLTALIYAVTHGGDQLEEVHRIGKALTFAVMAVTFAVLYRYFED